MSNFMHEYRPLQLAPPLGPNQLIQPPVQQHGPGTQQQLQVTHGQPRSAQPSPQPIEYGHNASSQFVGLPYPPPPPPPFDWVVSTVTSLLHSQHATVLTKFGEASQQQLDLATKVETLQRSTNALQRTVNIILENMQQVSDKVAKLGADMSSRDATLAQRLNTLDDAIEAWSTDARLATGAGELQTPPGSEAGMKAQPETRPVVQGQPALEQDQQLQSLDDLIQDAGSPDDTNEADGDGSQTSSDLSFDERTTNSSNPSKVSSQRRKNAGALQVASSATRRSGRQSKKRQRNDGTIEVPISKKRAKTAQTARMSTSGKVPRKQSASRKSALSQFDWDSVPIQDEELEQLIYCDKCDRAYHWGCVNILPEDPILQADTTWLCPPCEFEDQNGPIPGRTRDPDANCRPDCPVQEHADDMFAIDAIVGRFPHSADPSGTMMQYLVKWEDYPIQRSTWTPENEIGQASHALVRDFEKAALSENLDISDKSQLVLLQEAREGGWGYYTFPS
ncbi:unnamed protein product [Rhizoctonia solani]|uniref:Chromo domain-containing protein n=1 Tax=Rhizoctonia solani TaxID=456999 RepID=A0A8H3E3T2_9AGAM|nr:unnamed protein product [Rhizoctonia solani]